MRITKDVAVVGGGPAIAGATLEYVVQATNSGTVPAYAVVIRDDLAVPTPGYLTFVNGSYTMNDSTNGITVVDSLLTADYSTTYGALQPGGSITLRFRAVLNANLAIGTKVTNTGKVYWNDPQQTASASVSIDVGGMVGRRHPERPRRGTTPISTGRSMPRNACSKAGPSSSIETARLAYTATHGCDRCLSDQRRHTELPDCRSVRAEIHRARRGPRTAKLGVPIRLQATTCSGSRTSSFSRQQPAEPESADRAERRHLQLDVTRADTGRHHDDGPGRQPHCAAGELFRRSGAAGPGRARAGLLPLRPELLRSGVPDRRRLRPRSGGARVRLRCWLLADHSASGGGLDRGLSQCLCAPASADDAIPATSQRCEVQPSEFAAGAPR